MPTYEYRCANGHHFEQFQRMTEPPVDRCPQCAAPAERLLSTGAGLLFKGSGFYITDYRSDSYKKAAQAESGGGGDGGGKADKADKKSTGSESTSGSGSGSAKKSGGDGGTS